MSAQHTPPPMRGTWALIAPDGRKWEGDSPLRLAAAEQRERVPDQVAVQRVLDAASALRDDDLLMAAQAVADFLGGPKDRLGRPDPGASREAMDAREHVRKLAVQHGVGGAHTYIDQCAELLRAVARKAEGWTA